MFTVVPLFLSTPSARRATCLLTLYGSKEGISIHALREEGDGNVPCRRWRSIYFYPRPPRGGRRRPQQRQHRQGPISIHALREEGDHSAGRSPCPHPDFYPRPPRGGRRLRRTFLGSHGYFYPRPPRGGRRNTSYQRAMTDIFLSTPSARRATRPPCAWGSQGRYFYPRPPRGGRPSRSGRPTEPKSHFYPRPPRGGRP